MATVTVHNEVGAGEILDDYPSDGWDLWLQYCTYNYDDVPTQDGYRFIWRRPDGSLQPARGQARIPSLAIVEALIAAAKANGWGDHKE